MKLENMNQEFPKMPDAMRKMIEQGNQRILHNKDEERFLTLPNQDEIFRCIKTAQ